MYRPLAESHPGIHRRLGMGAVVVALAFFGLGARFYLLQIRRGSEWSSRGERNYVQSRELAHDRGIIYDRNGSILADERVTFDLMVTAAFLGGDAQGSLDHLSDLIGLEDGRAEQISGQVRSLRGPERYRPTRVLRDLDRRQVERIEAERTLLRLDGVEIIRGRRRSYPHGALAAHVIGYLNEVGPEQLRRFSDEGNPWGYHRGDLIGRRGIERWGEVHLRGRDGVEQVLVDAKGRRVTGSSFADLLAPGRVPATPGSNVFLTLDLALQRVAHEAFSGDAGAVVAMDVRTGEVLAMASFPTFDPNRIQGPLAAVERATMDTDPLKPRVNRAVQGQYAPGSTFKVASALAVVNAGVSPSEQVHCPGYFRLGRRAWRCHKDSGHGHVDLREALKVSCDTYFYSMAQRLGIDRIAAASRVLGFGHPSGFPIGPEQPGLVPDRAFHDRVDHATGGYQRGMALNTAIGQGSVLVTPLQLAVAYASLVNGGRVLEPQIVLRVETPDHRMVGRSLDADGSVTELREGSAPVETWLGRPRVRGRLGTDPAPLLEGLAAVAGEPGGTAYHRRSGVVTMGGKTGTAQVIRLGRERLHADEVPYEERDHAWFAGYAPVDAPELVVVVVNEHSGHGGSKAAPIAVAVIDAYFNGRTGSSVAVVATP